MRTIKKVLSMILAICLLSSFVTLVSATGYIHDFDNIEELRDYDTDVFEVANSVSWEYLHEMDTIYVLSGMKPSDAYNISVTDTFVQMMYMDGNLRYIFKYFHDTTAGGKRYNEIRGITTKANSPRSEYVGDTNVYSYYVKGTGSYYAWRQDGLCFELRVNTSQKLSDFELCAAYELSLDEYSNDIFIPEPIVTLPAPIPTLPDITTFETEKNIGPDNITGGKWKISNGKKYYFTTDGDKITKNTVIDGVRYKFDKNGVCGGVFTGWYTKNENNFYFYKGKLKTGWFISEKKKYYANKDGVVRTGWVFTEDGVRYFNSKGVWDGKTTYIVADYNPETIREFLLDFSFLGDEKILAETNILDDTSVIRIILEHDSDLEFSHGLNFSVQPYSRFNDDNTVTIWTEYADLRFSTDSYGNSYFWSEDFDFGVKLSMKNAYDIVLEELLLR